VGVDFLAALDASCFLGALPPVLLRAVCLVRAIFYFLVTFCLLDQKARETEGPHFIG
jgi:hypothetical protein